MKGLPAAVAAAFLVLLIVLSAATPVARFDHQAPPGATWLWGGAQHLPAQGTLLIQDATTSYTPAETAAIAAFVQGGGRLLLAGITPDAASLLQALDVGIQALPGLVFDPDADATGEIHLHGSGILGIGDLSLTERPHVILGGETVLITNDFVWQDVDADGVPDIGEPRGAWSVAAMTHPGQGAVLVLGAASMLEAHGPVQQWLRGASPLLVDGTHRGAPDPLGAAAVLSGTQPASAWGAVAIIAAVGGLTAWRVGLRRTGSKRRRAPADPETLEMLAELAG